MLTTADEQGRVFRVEGVGSGRKHLQQSNNSVSAPYRDGYHGTQAKRAATLPIHAIVRLGIVATQCPAGSHTFSRKSRPHLEPAAEWRSVRARAGHADHLIPLRQRDRRAAGSGLG